MAQLRGGQSLWKSVSVTGSGKSTLAAVGPGPYVSVYISNEGAVNATFKVQASVQVSPESGRNALDATADGGLTWYDYNGGTGLVVNAGTAICFDLSPYGPQFLRLVRTDGGANTAITAVVSGFGPN